MEQRNYKKDRGGVPRTVLPFLVLTVALVLTVVGTAYVNMSVRTQNDLRFQTAAHRVGGRIGSRVTLYTAMLRATDGLYAARWPVLPGEFKTYAGRLDLRKNYPGVLGIGTVVSFGSEQTGTFEQFMRNAMKFANFKVWPTPTKEDTATSVIYLEPLDERNARVIGYDMYTEPVRRAAMQRARDEGEAAASGEVILLQDQGEPDHETGFVIYMPVYAGGAVPDTVEDRRTKLKGYVFCPFRSKDLFGDVFSDESLNDLEVWIYDGLETRSDAGLLYKTAGAGTGPNPKQMQDGRVRMVAGRTWTIVCAAGPGFNSAPEKYLPVITGVAGTLLSLGLFLVMRSQVRGRMRAERVTADLQESQQALEAAKESAEAANRLKDEFLATVSHELRTPLNAILGWAQLLSVDHAGEDDVRQGVETILRNARMQTQLIEDLLDISRIVSGKLRLEARSVDLSVVVRAAIGSVQLAAEAKGVRLVDEVGIRPALVWGDPDRLQQVVWNLLSNSIKFTERDGTIHIRLEQEGEYASVIVSDTGAGIDPEFLPYVFERFRQADGTLTRKHGGLGLGLSIVRNLVELHGGKVRAESEGVGKGAAFIVSLPLRAGTPPRGTTGLRHVGVDTKAEALNGLKVLVVDDDPDTREVLRHILAGQRAEVVTAGSVSRAMEILRSQEVEVLVSDLAMPEEDGYDLIRMVRELPGQYGGKVPAVALSALVRPAERERALAAGYQTHLPKPVDAGDLVRVVAELGKRLRV
ncbi:MAG TPA: CHASE domain-containing protein [Tepidisphaeraceae bacterium]|jgi:signal transduction histidine kinase/ActR/RegA family two-component response regulator|nr:CHASE domain-containing protein [Tepidisphaeraceae bacterium]